MPVAAPSPLVRPLLGGRPSQTHSRLFRAAGFPCGVHGRDMHSAAGAQRSGRESVQNGRPRAGKTKGDTSSTSPHPAALPSRNPPRCPAPRCDSECQRRSTRRDHGDHQAVALAAAALWWQWPWWPHTHLPPWLVPPSTTRPPPPWAVSAAASDAISAPGWEKHARSFRIKQAKQTMNHAYNGPCMHHAKQRNGPRNAPRNEQRNDQPTNEPGTTQ